MELASATVEDENRNLDLNLPAQQTANQMRQQRKINRRRVISNAEVAQNRHLLHDANINLTNEELIELLEPEPELEPAVSVNPAPLEDKHQTIKFQNTFEIMKDWRSYT